MNHFRIKLLAAMMLVIVAITAAVLWFAQRNAEAGVRQSLQRQFQSEFGLLAEAQEARRAAIAERCRVLAKSVRIRAALEENDREDLYLNAAVELRDVLEEKAGESESRSLRAEFFRFLNAEGAIMQPPMGAQEEAWESQLALPGGVPDEQQAGYAVLSAGVGREVLREVIATPIITTDNGDAIGAIVLGFKPAELDGRRADADIKSGVWLNGRLHMPTLNTMALAQLSGELARVIGAREDAGDSIAITVNGAPHLLIFKRLNPGSRFPPAHQVCLYPLATALARQSQLRWEIIGWGTFVLLGGLVVSHFVAARLSAPVEELAQDSEANRAQCERAETALQMTEEKYRGIFENAVEGIFLLAPDGKFLSANPALARIVGFDSPAELVAMLDDPARQLYAEPEPLAEFLRRAEIEGGVSVFETEFLHRDGRKIWVSQNARAVRDAAGALLHLEGTLEDITERKRAATELLALNAELQSALTNLKTSQKQIIEQERLRALGQMASGIAHDFNNALVPILGFCELLLLSPAILDDRKKAGRYLETIQTAAKDAASVVSRLREFYRPDKSDREFAPVNLKRIVEQSITLTRPKWKDQAQAGGATVEVTLELDTVPSVSGEESALREVLTNLIFNAVDAMPCGGTITLRTRSDGNSAVIEVADTGSGMTEEVRKHCLDPFYSTKGERGTGLGLSMVFGIVQRHSGSLDIRSELGKGTTFVITLPLAEPAADRPVNMIAHRPHRPLRVLVVDDEAPVRDTIAAVLVADGHEVELAHDGADGLRRFIAGTFDLVVTDKAMPHMSGDRLAAAIKKLGSRTPIILLTGFGLFHDKTEFPDVDVLASKPIRIPTLRDAIATAMKAA